MYIGPRPHHGRALLVNIKRTFFLGVGLIPCRTGPLLFFFLEGGGGRTQGETGVVWCERRDAKSAIFFFRPPIRGLYPTVATVA